MGIRWRGGRECDDEAAPPECNGAVEWPSSGAEKSTGLWTPSCEESSRLLSSGLFTSVSSSVRRVRRRLRNCSKLLYESPKGPMLISVGVSARAVVGGRSTLGRVISSTSSLNSNSFTSPFERTCTPGVFGVGVGGLLGLRSGRFGSKQQVVSKQN